MIQVQPGDVVRVRAIPATLYGSYIVRYSDVPLAHLQVDDTVLVLGTQHMITDIPDFSNIAYAAILCVHEDTLGWLRIEEGYSRMLEVIARVEKGDMVTRCA